MESMESESVLPPVDSPPASSPSGGLEGLDWVVLLENARQYKASVLLLTPAITIFLWFFVSYQLSPLKKYPGPFLAGVSHLALLFRVLDPSQPPRSPRLTYISLVNYHTPHISHLLTINQDGPTSGGSTIRGPPTMAHMSRSSTRSTAPSSVSGPTSSTSTTRRSPRLSTAPTAAGSRPTSTRTAAPSSMARSSTTCSARWRAPSTPR